MKNWKIKYGLSLLVIVLLMVACVAKPPQVQQDLLHDARLLQVGDTFDEVKWRTGTVNKDYSFMVYSASEKETTYKLTIDFRYSGNNIVDDKFYIFIITVNKNNKIIDFWSGEIL